VLGEGTRSSGFFMAAFNEQFEASGSDLTALLPAVCHDHIETVIDFIYGQEINIDSDNCVVLYKIADALQIDALLPIALASIRSSDRSDCIKIFRIAVDLDIAIEVIEVILYAMRLSDMAKLASTADAYSNQVWSLLFKHYTQKVEEVRVTSTLRSPHLTSSFENGVRRLVINQDVCQFQEVDPVGISSCAVRLVKTNTCYGMAIGVSRHDANLFTKDRYQEWHNPGVGGFVGLKGCWGLSIHKNKLICEGAVIADTRCKSEFFEGKVIRMDLNMEEQTLRFLCQDQDGKMELGVIQAGFSRYASLMFTVSACCHACELQVLHCCLSETQYELS